MFRCGGLFGCRREGEIALKKWAWIGFWVLGLTWGSSFLFIRLSVAEINAFQTMFTRVVLAAIGMLIIVRVRGLEIPTDRKTLVPLILIGIGNNAIPFTLIGWSETVIPSSMAAILQATVVLFTLIIAHFVFDDEHMSIQRVGGIALGFIGVMVLFGGGLSGDAGEGNGLRTFWGQLGMVGSSVFYASFLVYSRKVLKGNVAPMVVATVSMCSAAVTLGIVTLLSPLVGGPAPVWLWNVSGGAAAAVITLGLFNTLFAYAMFYSIVSELGASRTSMVTYVVPVVGLLLGVVFANEPLTASLFGGAVLIMSGIGIVNLPKLRKGKIEAAASAS